MLGLGDHIVRELKFAEGVDTLGRWMSPCRGTHHSGTEAREGQSDRRAGGTSSDTALVGVSSGRARQRVSFGQLR